MRFLGTFLLAGVVVPLLYAQQGEWPAYGHDPSGQRYSPLTQINPKNVSKLKLAWQYGIDSGAIDNSAGESRADWNRSRADHGRRHSVHAHRPSHHRRAGTRDRKGNLEIRSGQSGRAPARRHLLAGRQREPGRDLGGDQRRAADRAQRQDRQAGSGIRQGRLRRSARGSRREISECALSHGLARSRSTAI